jgi:hypothetical protein
MQDGFVETHYKLTFHAWFCPSGWVQSITSSHMPGVTGIIVVNLNKQEPTTTRTETRQPPFDSLDLDQYSRIRTDRQVLDVHRMGG